MSDILHSYVCEKNERTVYVTDRKTKPRIGQIITAFGTKWQVWYVEERPAGYCRARLEPYLDVEAWRSVARAE